MIDPHTVGKDAAHCGRELAVRRWPRQGDTPADMVAEEIAVALSYNGLAHVVMMMTPADLEDFALGFSLSEGVVERATEVRDIVIESHRDGLEIALTIASARMAALRRQRRNLTGRTGCGLCGAESLEQAIRGVAKVRDSVRVPATAIDRALADLNSHQPLQRLSGASHGAAWCAASGAILCAREDVGRHNALDKLIGALARGGQSRADGFALVSSRASYEMVTKAARAGMEVLVAVSAPTTLAVELATDAGLTLVGFARPGRFSVYSAPARIMF